MIYLDHHATTPLDPQALDAMLPLLKEQFANAGSITHEAGREVAQLVDSAIARIATCIGADKDEIVVTSGATESNNLAIFGACLHPRQKRRKIVSVVTEHKAVLDPLARIRQQGFSVTLVPVRHNGLGVAGLVDMQSLSDAIDGDTAMVTVMLANNEIGTIQPLTEIAGLCRKFDCLLHTDATQAVGRIPVDVDALDVDLLSFSAHKFYGPKGIGGLYVRRRGRRVKLQGQIVGGGQQHNFRSGTLNTAGIVGMRAALETTLASMPTDQQRISEMRDRLFRLLVDQIESVELNGPAWEVDSSGQRLHGNLNCCFYPLEGQSLMLEMPQLAVSSGSACTSAEPEPSHVLRAIGRTEEQSRSSLRFGIGRFNTHEEIDQAAAWVAAAADKLSHLL